VKRIGIDYTSAVRQGAGIGRYTRHLIGALAELDHENRYVLFSAGRDRSDGSWPSNFTRRELPLTDRHLAIIWQRLKLPAPVEWITGRLDLFHSPDFTLPPVRRAATALTVHDLSFMRYPECSSPALWEYLMDAVPRSAARADIILADSECTRRDIVELLRIPEDRVYVIYAGVEPRFTPNLDEAAERAALSRYGLRKPFILGLGTLQPRKNFARLIRAYHLARQRHHLDHQLVIGGGPGWLYEDIYDTIHALALENEVRLIGFVDDADLPALYRAAAVFAFPSLYEGFGIPVLEAMGCGAPVVASATSSLPEVAGDAALMVDPFDIEALAEALGRLINDAALRDDLRHKGFQRAERFTWQRSARELLTIYQL